MNRRNLLTILVASFICLTGVANAHGPTRQKVVVEREINASVAEVWAMVGDFSALHKWLPPVDSSEIISGEANVAGAIRRLHIGDNIIEEKLKSIKPDRMKLKYKIVKGDIEVLPVQNYSSTISVTGDENSAKVKWLGAFYRGYMNNDPPPNLNDQAAIDAVTGLYNLGLDKLKTVLEKQ